MGHWAPKCRFYSIELEQIVDILGLQMNMTIPHQNSLKASTLCHIRTIKIETQIVYKVHANGSLPTRFSLIGARAKIQTCCGFLQILDAGSLYL